MSVLSYRFRCELRHRGDDIATGDVTLASVPAIGERIVVDGSPGVVVAVESNGEENGFLLVVEI